MKKNWIVKFYNNKGTYFEDTVVLDAEEFVAMNVAKDTYALRVDIARWEVEELEELPVGCIFDSHRGVYISREIQALACRYGWDESKAVVNMNDEDYHEAGEEATEYLNQFAPEGHYAGWYDGDWGVYPIEEDDFDGTEY